MSGTEPTHAQPQEEEQVEAVAPRAEPRDGTRHQGFDTPIAGSLTRVEFDFAVSLLLDDGHQIRLSGIGTSEVKGGSEIFDPEEAANVALHLIGALHGPATVSVDGSDLVVRLGEREREMVITIPPSAEHEAWQLSAPDRSLVVCMPGGGLAS